MSLEENRSARLHVLIVDDVEINVDILANIMEQLGYIPLPAGSAAEALKKIKQTLPQLILLDVSMPEVDGYELCAILKKNPVTREIPVIFISAMDTLKDKLKGLELGAADFITKPFEITEVTMRVKNQMENVLMKQELERFNRQLHKMLTEQTRKIDHEKKEIMCSLARLAEKRSGVPVSHLDNIGYNSRILAQSLQLSPIYEAEISEDFIELIETASKLHDLGKLWEISEYSHIETGVYLIQDLLSTEQQGEFKEMVLDIIRFHHADWQGTKGAEIPLAARIVRITNDFDTFVAESRKAENALAESLEKIEAGSGVAYDPELIEIFIKIQRQLRIN